MSGYIRRGDRLFDPVTGAVVGFVDLAGNEVAIPVLSPGGSLIDPRTQSPVSGDVPVPAAQIVAGTLGAYTAETRYVVSGSSGGVEDGTEVRWSNTLGAWVFDFYRSAKVL